MGTQVSGRPQGSGRDGGSGRSSSSGSELSGRWGSKLCAVNIDKGTVFLCGDNEEAFLCSNKKIQEI